MSSLQYILILIVNKLPPDADDDIQVSLFQTIRLLSILVLSNSLFYPTLIQNIGHFQFSNYVFGAHFNMLNINLHKYAVSVTFIYFVIQLNPVKRIMSPAVIVDVARPDENGAQYEAVNNKFHQQNRNNVKGYFMKFNICSALMNPVLQCVYDNDMSRLKTFNKSQLNQVLHDSCTIEVNGCDITLNNGIGALHLAIILDRREIAKYLLQAKVQFHDDDNGMQEIHYLAQNQNVSTQKYLIPKLSQQLTAISDNGYNLLHYVAESNNNAFCSTLEQYIDYKRDQKNGNWKQYQLILNALSMQLNQENKLPYELVQNNDELLSKLKQFYDDAIKQARVYIYKQVQNKYEYQILECYKYLIINKPELQFDFNDAKQIPQIRFFLSYNCYLCYSMVSIIFFVLIGVSTQINTLTLVIFQCSFVCTYYAQNVKQDTTQVIFRSILQMLIIWSISLFSMRCILQILLQEADPVDIYVTIKQMSIFNRYIYAFFLSKMFYTLVSMSPKPNIRILIASVTLIIQLSIVSVLQKFYQESFFVDFIKLQCSYGLGFLTLQLCNYQWGISQISIYAKLSFIMFIISIIVIFSSNILIRNIFLNVLQGLLMLFGICEILKSILDEEDGSSGVVSIKQYEILFMFISTYFGYQKIALSLLQDKIMQIGTLLLNAVVTVIFSTQFVSQSKPTLLEVSLIAIFSLVYVYFTRKL